MLTRYLLQFISLHHFRRHPLRTLLSLLGMIVGVTTFIFAPTISDTIRRSLDVTASDFGGGSDLEIRNGSGGLENGLLAQMQQAAGVQQAAPLVTQGGLILNQEELLTFFGIDPRLDRNVRSYELATGRFLAQPGEALLTVAYANEKDIHVGEAITLVGPGDTISTTVVGVLGDHGPARLNGGDVVFICIDDAWQLRGNETLDTISIVAEEGADLDALQERLGAALPPNAVVESPQARFEQVDAVLDMLDMILGFCAFFILILGATLIYNTLAVAVVQRRNEVGVLRALGVTRGKVQTLFLVEAAFLGVVGSLLGVAAGFGLVGTAGKLIAMPALGSLISYAEFRIPAYIPPLALAAGILIALAAGYLPARAATQVDPLDTFGNTPAETRHLQMNRARLLAVIALLALGLLLVASYDHSPRGVPVVLIGSASTVIAAVVAFPLLLAALRNILPALMQRLAGPAGLIAAENLTRRPGRMLATGTILVLGMWLLMHTGVASFGYGDLVKGWDRSENVWDLTLTGADLSFLIPPDVVEAISRRPEVAATAMQRTVSVTLNGKAYNLRAEDIAQFRAQGGRHLLASGDELTVYGRMQEHDHPALMFVGANIFMEGLEVGQTVTLETPKGAVVFDLVGSPLTFMTDGFDRFIIDYPLFAQLWGDDSVDVLQIKLRPGSDVQAIRREMTQAYATRGLVVFSASDRLAIVKKTFSVMASTASMMTLLTVVTLVIGLANTLMMMIFDRRREIGMLRAAGMLRREINASVVLEAVLLVLLASLLTVPVGVFTTHAMSLVVQHLVGIQMPTNPLEVTAVVLIALLTAAAAAYLPARSAGRMDVLDALKVE